MGARQKLNRGYVNGSLLAAAAVGWLGQSWPAFALTLAVLLACNLFLGEIRPRPGRRG
jgi:hypothetical protein